MDRIVATDSSKEANVFEPGIKVWYFYRSSGRVARNLNVLRGDESIERRDRTDRTNVVAANGEFIAEKEAFKNRNAIDERQRLRVSDLRRCGETTDGRGYQPEAEHFRVLRLLSPHGEELGV